MTVRHCLVSHVRRAIPYAPAASTWWYGPLSWRLKRDEYRTPNNLIACTMLVARRPGKKRKRDMALIAPGFELPDCPTCAVLWDVDESLRTVR